MKVEKLVPKSTKFHEKFLESKKNMMQKEEKPLYKMKMFNNVGSRVVEGIKKFKTNEFYTQNDNIDNLIAKVENELNDLGTN
jgi:pyruvate/2-oxoacid:ferredoxin oxidoreductase alpha subunit